MIRKEKIELLESYINELKTIKMDYMDNNGKFLNIERYKCLLNNGKNITREKILKGRSDGSASIIMPIIKHTGEIIFSVEPRVFTKAQVCVNLPAGYLEKGETGIDAARRELLEETGFIFNDYVHLGSFYQDQGCSSALNEYILGLDCVKQANQNLDDGEFIKYFICNYDEAKYLINSGYVCDTNSVLAFERAKQYIRK